MKNNLVKILATLALIVAIALVLKGVFGVGKIGFNKIISNSPTKITFENCYEEDVYKNYKHSKERDSSMENQIFEIDISTKRVVRTTIWSDEFVQKKKDIQNKGISIATNKIDQDTMIVDSYTDNFITTKPFKVIDFNSKHILTDVFIFNLKNGTYENLSKFPKDSSYMTDKYKCEKIKGS